MKKSAIILILAFISVSIFAQVAPQKYFLEFTDKNNSPYSITRPAEFLSARAIERRQRQGIAIEPGDLPVNQSYVNGVMKYGVQVLTRSKWLNGITVYCQNPSVIDAILQLPFVKHAYKSNILKNLVNSKSDNKLNLYELLLKENKSPAIKPELRYNGNRNFDYGAGYNQIHMMQGDSLHKMGYRGEGMIIAVLDAGFFRVDALPAFDSLRLNNQIIGTRDFVKPGNNVYNEYEHGMEVLSCMGGNMPGELIGTAPKANYWLLRSEDAGSEFIIEEYNWAAAAEFADSAGADIINSSLGYTVFNDEQQNHTCSDMNGSTTIATKAANIAFSKGMIVVNSAGNSGTSGWKCVSSPADGFGVIAVAAVDSNGVRADFSSVGEATRRIKPNVAAMGRRAVVSSTVGPVMYNNGTSFASPILAGLVACFWQAAPSLSNQLVARAVEVSASQASHPDSLLGYGIPNFIKAMQVMNIDKEEGGNVLRIYPNPFLDAITIVFNCPHEQEVDIRIINILGKEVISCRGLKARAGENEISVTDLNGVPSGNYILQLTGTDFLLNSRVIRGSR